jgi:hypothetical protein
MALTLSTPLCGEVGEQSEPVGGLKTRTSALNTPPTAALNKRRRLPRKGGGVGFVVKFI